MRRRRAACVVLLGVGLGNPARAQIAPLVPGADRPDRVLERRDWVSQEPLALEDLLRQVAGVAVARRGALGGLEYLCVAGSPNGRIQLVLDGVDLGEAELAWPRLQAVPLALLDRIEIDRGRDPVRIALWTRRSESSAPHVDFDLGRGTLTTRTRRAQLFTPVRAIDVAVIYDELLRAGDDFRPRSDIEVGSDLGAYDDRNIVVRIDLRRGGEVLRVEHARQDDNAHGSVQSTSDLTHSHHARTGLRWERPLGGARLLLDVSHLVWDRTRRVRGALTGVQEGRTAAALDLELPPRGAWTGWVRLRATEVSGDRSIEAPLRRDLRRQEAELEIGRGGALRGTVWAGLHRDVRAGVAASARALAAMDRGGWTLTAELGRGTSFSGWAEVTTPVERRGTSAALRLQRRSAGLELQAELLAKRLDGRSATAAAFFPGTSAGPADVASALLDGTWRRSGARWVSELRGGLGWTTTRGGDRAGMPRAQARLGATLGRTLRGGDLTLSLHTDWRLDGARRFAAGSAAAAAQGDVQLEARVLRRADVFFGVRNVGDVRVETFPGVELPGRTSWLGVRVRLLD